MRMVLCAAVLAAVGLAAGWGSSGLVRCSQAEEKLPSKVDKSAKPLPTPTNDLAAIRAGLQSFVEAVNKHDAKAVAALWTKDGEYIDDGGQKYQGRAAIEACYENLFKNKSQAKLRVVVDSIRLLSDTAAIEDGRAFLDPPPAGAPGTSKYSVVHVKVDGKWLMASARDQWVDAPSTYENVADLEWLIGTWVSEEHGTKSESVCRWIANKNFVERRYTATRADGTSSSGVQIIGWNPSAGHVQSWNFSSDGGHAVGIWSPTEKGWSAEIEGMTGEGVATTAINLLTRLDDNAYVWQSTKRTLGDQTLADTDEVVLKRTAEAP
jgi:uncharacterized protein (TIGR02246 family)